MARPSSWSESSPPIRGRSTASCQWAIRTCGPHPMTTPSSSGTRTYVSIIHAAPLHPLRPLCAAATFVLFSLGREGNAHSAQTLIVQSLDEVYKIQNAHSGYCYGLADFGSVVWTFGWDKRICLWDTKVPAAPSCPSPLLPHACQTTAEGSSPARTSPVGRPSKTWASCRRTTATPSGRWSRCGTTRRPAGRPGTLPPPFSFYFFLFNFI